MEQYIDKSAVVAEIKRRKELVSEPILSGDDLMIGERNAYFNLLSFLETLDVKEVDLEKELIKWHKQHYKTDDTFEKYSGFYFTNHTQIELAKHFFELGLSFRNKNEEK